MNEKITIRRFAETDAETVQNIIHRGLREINGKDYPAELMEEYCNYFTPKNGIVSDDEGNVRVEKFR